MTRGYVCIVDRNTIEQVAYLQSDAYLSGYGLEILTERQKGIGALTEWIVNQHKYNIECYGKEDDPCKDFALNWIQPDQYSKSCPDWNYEEYGYVFYVRSLSVKVYYQGTLLFTIKADDEEIEKYMYLFQFENGIYNVLSYDAEKLDNVLGFEKAMKLARKCTLPELKELVKKAEEEERIYLEDYHCMAPGCIPGQREYYQKPLSSTDPDKKELTFILEHDHLITDHGWEILVQAPYCRFRYCNRTFRSERGAMRWLKEEVRKNSDAIFRLAEIFTGYQEAKENGTLKDFANTLDDEWERNPWIYRAYCCKEYIQARIKESA